MSEFKQHTFKKIPQQLVQQIIDGFIEVSLIESDGNNVFKIIRESLTRIGVLIHGNKLIQLAHILHKKGKYYIVHHKQLKQLDGMGEQMSDLDYKQLGKIVLLLARWNLLTITDDKKIVEGSINTYVHAFDYSTIKEKNIQRISKYQI